MSTFSLTTANDMSAFNCTSKTCKRLPEELQITIANYVESMYVNDRRKYDLAERARMCVRLVREKELAEISAAQEDFAYARLWYENAIRDTEKLYYENKGKATDDAMEAAMESRQRGENVYYREYLNAATNYNSVLEDKKELLNTTAYTWAYGNEIIDDRDEDRRIIAEDWITKREIDDGLWDPQGYAPERDVSENAFAQIHPLDDDGPAIGCGCWGCAEGQPNQEAHMGPGGCLHMPSDTESDIGSKYSCTEYDQDEDYYLSDTKTASTGKTPPKQNHKTHKHKN